MIAKKNALKILLKAAVNIRDGLYGSAKRDLKACIEIIEVASAKPDPERDPTIRRRSYFSPGLSGGCTRGVCPS